VFEVDYPNVSRRTVDKLGDPYLGRAQQSRARTEWWQVASTHNLRG
jgi:hypothetical protein